MRFVIICCWMDWGYYIRYVGEGNVDWTAKVGGGLGESR